eukprot:scaffold16243_cov59-Phaeocystis_antarctica.AAC.7
MTSAPSPRKVTQMEAFAPDLGVSPVNSSTTSMANVRSSTDLTAMAMVSSSSSTNWRGGGGGGEGGNDGGKGGGVTGGGEGGGGSV